MYNLLNDEQKKYIVNLLFNRVEFENIKNKELKEIINNTDIDENFTSDINDITSILRYNFSDKEAKFDGITFTPIPIVIYMYEDVLSLNPHYITTLKIADLSVGNGAFFIGLIIYLKKTFQDISIVSLIENNLYGYDTREENIFFTKLNLYLITLFYGENPEDLNFNLFKVDTLKYFKDKDVKFDLIVGNPPYVKQQNISKDYRPFLLENFETINSNYNLYYAFLELSIKLLTKNGISLQLVPNYLLKIKSAMSLRQYLFKGNHIQKIVNFNANKVFKGIDIYSMIVELSRFSNEILYKSLPNNNNSLSYLYEQNWKKSVPSNITHDSVNLIDDKLGELVNKVQSQLFILDISTGIATQKDKLFLIDNSNLIDNKYMTKFYNGKEYFIEKESVVRVYKGSGQEKEHLKYSYIIYPYTIKNNIATIKSQEYLIEKEPLTYEYFVESKFDLIKRSGINEKDSNWYRYGRTQSLNRFEPKILFPTNTIKPNFNLIEDSALFFNGYAIYGLKGRRLSLDELKALEFILNSKLVEIFMLSTSYFIGSGYVSYQKKYIEKVTIPLLTDEQTNKILRLGHSNNQKALNEYIFNIYGLDYNDYIE